MHCKPNHKNGNSKNEIISYRFYYSGRDLLSGRTKKYTMTWKVPKGLTNAEIKKERTKAMLEFENECEKKGNGTYIQEDYTTFKDFAENWKEQILIRNPDAISYYIRAEYSLNIINKKFSNYLLRQISPSMVQSFYNYLCTRTYEKKIVTVKKSINEIADLNKSKVANETGLNVLTVRLASKIGQTIHMETAEAISKYFKVPKTKYFNIERKNIPYAKATNAGIRTILVVILGEAKRLGLIEHNYASKEYNKPIVGNVKDKEIYNEEESKEFVKAVLKEPNIRKKTIFSILIFLGLRKSEICGLSWNDINFENKTISIRHGCIYFGKRFGIRKKGTKTRSSKRTLTMPEQLFFVLKEYQVWWNEQQSIFWDSWENKNMLFLQDNGSFMSPSNIDNWVRKFEMQHGFRHIPPHSLRHTAISMQLAIGVPLKVVSKMAGHSNERITLDIYTHCTQAQETKAAALYNDFLCS